jgi:hypothetical protein
MLGDEFTKECRSLEKYIQLLLVHPVFSNDENLRKFLIDEEVLPDIYLLSKFNFYHSTDLLSSSYLFISASCKGKSEKRNSEQLI